jgi:hypothetical protein
MHRERVTTGSGGRKIIRALRGLEAMAAAGMLHHEGGELFNRGYVTETQAFSDARVATPAGTRGAV